MEFSLDNSCMRSLVTDTASPPDSSRDKDRDADTRTSGDILSLLRLEAVGIWRSESFTREGLSNSKVDSGLRDTDGGSSSLELLVSFNGSDCDPSLESYRTEADTRLSIHEPLAWKGVAGTPEILPVMGDGEAGTSTTPLGALVSGVIWPSSKDLED